MISLILNTNSMYKEFVLSFSDSLFTPISQKETIDNFVEIVKGLVTGNIEVIIKAFGDGFTPSLVNTEDMRKLEAAVDENGNSVDDINIIIHHDGKLILSLVNDQIVW